MTIFNARLFKPLTRVLRVVLSDHLHRRPMVLNVKPLLFLGAMGWRSLIPQIHIRVPQLKSYTSEYCYSILTRLGLVAEKLAKQLKMGLYPQICFTEMHKDCNVQHPIGI